jgi:hypothetical protein
MATWFDDSNTKVGEMSDEEELINDDDDNDYESGYGYLLDTGVFTHAKKFRDKRVEEHKSYRTVPGPLKKDDIGGEESGEEDKAVKKGAVGKGAVEKGNNDSDGNQKERWWDQCKCQKPHKESKEEG